MKRIAAGLTAVLAASVLLVSAAPTQASIGTFDRAWGENVDSVAAGTGFEICTLPANCQAGSTVAPALGGELSFPAGSDTDAAGNVYVADAGFHRVQVFDAAGNFLRAWGEDVVSSGQHETGTGFEICVNAAGSEPDDVCKAGSTASTALGGEMSNPNAIAIDSLGNVYVADLSHNRIQKFDSTGTFLFAWGKNVNASAVGTGPELCVALAGHVCQTGETTTAIGGEMSFPLGVAVDSADNVYVVDSTNNRIQKFDSNGTFLLAWGEDVVSTGLGNTGVGIFEICPAANAGNCKIGTTMGAPVGGEMSFPAAVGTDAAANVYVADNGHNRIQKFDSAGNFLRAWGENVVTTGEHNTGAGFEICVNPAGSDPDDICKQGNGGSLGGDMSQPQGIATDSAANVYVGDTTNNRVQRFDSAGNFLRAWGEDVVSSGPGNTGTGFEICVAANLDTCQAGTPIAPALGGEFNTPSGIGTDPAGAIYVGDQLNHRIQKFAADPVPTGPGTTPVTSTTTGQRAAALKKCKRKKTSRARKKCKKKAKKLPL